MADQSTQFPSLKRRRHGDLPTPMELARQLRHLPGLVFLDSASAEEGAGRSDQERFSLVTALPRRIHEGNLFCEADAEGLRFAWEAGRKAFGESADLGFPTGGLYGSIGYEGDFLFGEYDQCLVFDHGAGEWFESGSLSQQRRIAPLAAATPPGPFAGDTSPEEFIHQVERAQQYIAAGDIYQANLSHRFSAPLPPEFDSLAFYGKLRERSPAPYAAYLCQPGREILSSSPEQFLSLSGRAVQTRPIKGTRPRYRDREEDEKSAYDLITSAKEVAELIMITDLERNDLGQICEFGSVEVTELLKLERFAQVFHLVSTVAGTVRPEIGPIETLRACFPGGSITGAPKKRAREIIAELEKVPRGLYTGSIGCFGFNGESRFNIAIRTLVRERGELHFHVGAGIVADSLPKMEWEETLHKAAGIFQTAASFSAPDRASEAR